jgi:hypothetical protein
MPHQLVPDNSLATCRYFDACRHQQQEATLLLYFPRSTALLCLMHCLYHFGHSIFQKAQQPAIASDPADYASSMHPSEAPRLANGTATCCCAPDTVPSQHNNTVLLALGYMLGL